MLSNETIMEKKKKSLHNIKIPKPWIVLFIEYSSLNATMDEINSFMDALERQNDNLFTKLQQLLENNQQTRQEMEAERLEKEQVVDLEKNMEVEQTVDEREEKCE